MEPRLEQRVHAAPVKAALASGAGTVYFTMLSLSGSLLSLLAYVAFLLLRGCSFGGRRVHIIMIVLPLGFAALAHCASEAETENLPRQPSQTSGNNVKEQK